MELLCLSLYTFFFPLDHHFILIYLFFFFISFSLRFLFFLFFSFFLDMLGGDGGGGCEAHWRKLLARYIRTSWLTNGRAAMAAPLATLPHVSLSLTCVCVYLCCCCCFLFVLFLFFISRSTCLTVYNTVLIFVARSQPNLSFPPPLVLFSISSFLSSSCIHHHMCLVERPFLFLSLRPLLWRQERAASYM